MLALNALFLGAGVFANLGFEEIGLDLYVVALWADFRIPALATWQGAYVYLLHDRLWAGTGGQSDRPGDEIIQRRLMTTEYISKMQRQKNWLTPWKKMWSPCSDAWPGA